MPADPVASLSYVRLDDQHEEGRITRLRERLEGEIQMQTGRTVRILQDRQDIGWGNGWKQWIEDSLGAVAFLIPVITPSYFQSVACRNEFVQFREREQALGRADLVLPIYYVEADEFSDQKLREADQMAAELARRQYADWRELRSESLTSARVRKTLETMARQIKAALPAAPGRPSRSAPRPKPTQPVSVERLADTSGPSPRSEPPTVVVDGFHRGDYATLAEAIAQAAPGTRILVRPGYYPEGIVLDKPLEIIGDGPRDEITLAATECNTLHFRATMGRISGLTLRQTGGGKWYSVNITQGRLFLEDCDILNESMACVAVHNGADPVVRANRIHGGGAVGVYVSDSGRGTFEANDIAGNSIGFVITTAADPVVRTNRIHDGKTSGVFVSNGGRGAFEDNDIAGNGLVGLWVQNGADPVVRANWIRRNSYAGVLVLNDGRGTYENNHLWDNKGGPWDIASDAGEIVRRGNVEGPPDEV